MSSLVPTRSILALALLASLAGCSGGDGGSRELSEETIRLNILGTAYLGQQKWTEAGAEFDRALASRPADPLLLTNRAIAYNQAGEIDLAAERLREALAVEPDHLQANYNLGLIESRSGNFEAAVGHFEVVARQDARDLFTQYYLASSLSRVGRDDEAVAAYRAALELDPDHVSTLYGLGRTLLQRGQQEEGTRLIQRSQEVRARSGLDEAVGGQYGEQGPYAIGIDYPGDALRAPQPVPVEFGDRSRLAAGDGPEIPPFARLEGSGEAASLLAPGTESWGDLASLGVLALRPGDLDGDGVPELVLIAADSEGAQLLVRRTGEEPSSAGRLPAALHADLVPVDRDHDGDLDLFLCWSGGDAGSGCMIATNDGQGSFELRDSTEHGFALDGVEGAPAVAFSDFDNDRDVDLIVAEPAGVHVYSNLRDGNFADVSGEVGLDGVGSSSISVVDLDKDGRMDFVVTTPRVEFLRNRKGGFERWLSFDTDDTVAPRAVLFDFDNDGFLDLARSGPGGVLLSRNLGGGEWEERPQPLGGVAGAPLAAFDEDGDGDLDLAVWEIRGGEAELALYRNDGGDANRWIRLRSRGVGDNRRGVGAKVEVLAGALRQKFEVRDPLPLHVGLGARESVQAARYLWPSGVLQDEVELGAGATVEVEQLDRKGTSCPLLYAWRGGEWRFVTDFLGGSAVGYQLAPGVFSRPDTDEYVKIEGGLGRDEEGYLRVRLNNQLEEVIWFDGVELIAIDHPEGSEVFPEERLLPGPPYSPFALFASTDLRPVAAATEVERGREITERLRHRDGIYADGFSLLPPKGYAEPHTLELDLGPLPARGRVVLLLDGWIDYADSSSNVAARQAGLPLVPPILQVPDGRGGWIDADDRIGFPAGLPKAMTVDLTDAIRRADPRIRIHTTMRIYWDRARTLVGGEETDLRVERLEAASAELRFGGFPQPIGRRGPTPLAYDPQVVSELGGWKAHVGAYTAFGDVRELLEGVDDALVTTRSGDEIELRFLAPADPAPGMTRTYLLFADGFGKDMDPNSAAAERVGPVPFHGMPVYPYPDDVVPPLSARPAPSRLVLPSGDGIPGALPLVLAGR